MSFTSLAMRGLDAYLTREPNYPEQSVPGDPDWPRCAACGAFLKGAYDPDADEFEEVTESCPGLDGADHDATRLLLEGPVVQCGSLKSHAPHQFTAHAAVIHHRTCAKCGADNTEVDA
jgi:hypothetical protein